MSVVMAWSTHAASQRYMADFRAAKQREADADRIISDWRKPRPPDPQLGPQTWGEWTYLGGFPTYREGYHGGPGSQLIRLQFGRSGGIKKLFREEAFDGLTKETGLEELYFHGIIDDNNVAKLKPLKWIKHLELIDSTLTDQGFEELMGLDSVERLRISKAPLTASSLKMLSDFKSLESIELTETKISNEDRRNFLISNNDWKSSPGGQEIERRRISK